MDDDLAVDDLRDPRLSSALVEQGDQLLESDPVRAGESYFAASEAGASSADLAAKRAQAAWSCGDIDSAAQLLDEAMTFAERSESVTARIADVAAATWSMRGMLHTGSGFYDAFPPTTAEASVRRLIARIGVGEAGTIPAAAALISAVEDALSPFNVRIGDTPI